MDKRKGKWVYAPESIGYIPGGTVGKVLDERSETYQVQWFTLEGIRICVIPKEFVLEYDITKELEDLALLICNAAAANDHEWLTDLQQRYSLLKQLYDGKEDMNQHQDLDQQKKYRQANK
ncbi:MAG TPA: hypothetical protein VNM45_09160 [Bacillus sp. (in: firmicutes)]|nr:hypothetical protein [Bacillus sp. (in: firmicutes)]